MPREINMQQRSREERRAQKMQLRYGEALAMARRRWPAIAAVADEHPFVEAAVLARNRYVDLVDRWFAATRGFTGVKVSNSGLLDDWRLSPLDPAMISASAVFCYLVYRDRAVRFFINSVILLLITFMICVTVIETRDIWFSILLAFMAGTLAIGMRRHLLASRITANAYSFLRRINKLEAAQSPLKFRLNCDFLFLQIAAVFCVFDVRCSDRLIDSLFSKCAERADVKLKCILAKIERGQ